MVGRRNEIQSLRNACEKREAQLVAVTDGVSKTSYLGAFQSEVTLKDLFAEAES